MTNFRESAYDAGAIGFIAKFLVQTTLPHRRQPGSQYTRTDGHFTLRITDVGGAGLPYGSYPRLILIWMTSEAIRTSSRELELGASLSRFMAELGLQATGGHWGTIPRFRDQMQRLIGAAISTRWEQDGNGQHLATGENLIARRPFPTLVDPADPSGRAAGDILHNAFGRFLRAACRISSPARSARSPRTQAIAVGARSLRLGNPACQLSGAAYSDLLGGATPEFWEPGMPTHRKAASSSAQGFWMPSGVFAASIPLCVLRSKTTACCFFPLRRIFRESRAERRRRLFPVRGRRFSPSLRPIAISTCARRYYRLSI